MSAPTKTKSNPITKRDPEVAAQAILRELHGMLDYEQKGGATVVRIERVRELLLRGGVTTSNGR